jgi:hypothetical protein
VTHIKKYFLNIKCMYIWFYIIRVIDIITLFISSKVSDLFFIQMIHRIASVSVCIKLSLVQSFLCFVSQERNHLGGICLSETTILQFIIKKQDLNSIGWGQDPVAGFFEQSDGTLGSMEAWNFIDQLSSYGLFKKKTSCFSLFIRGK